MKYKLLRIDFTNGEKCLICGRSLPSNTGVALINLNTSEEGWAGSYCSKKEAINPTEAIPNLVKATYLLEPDDDERTDPYSKSEVSYQSELSSTDITDSDALCYLILRQNKLTLFSNISFKKLEPIYANYKLGLIQSESMSYLKNLIKSNEQKNPELGLRRLRNIYACKASIERCMKNNPENSFFKGLLKYLIENKSLSPKQIEKMNEELVLFGVKHKISPSAFS